MSDLSGDDLDHVQTDLALSDDDAKVPLAGEDPDDEDSARKIDPSTSAIKRVRNPQPKLNAERLRGAKGVQTIEDYFQGFKWQGKNHEASDLNKVMKRLEHWGHRLYPKYNFDDFLDKVAALGTKKDVQTFLTKYRKDMLTEDLINMEENGIQDEDEREGRFSPEPVDDFDRLIAEQLEKTRQSQSEISVNKENSTEHNVSSSTPAAATVQMDEEMKKNIERKRLLALEKKMARLREIENKKAAAKSQTVELQEETQTDVSTSQSLGQSEVIEPVEKETEMIVEEPQVSSSTAPTEKERDNSSGDDSLNISRVDPTPALTPVSVESNLSTTMNTTTGKRALTNEELDREIDDAVFNFMNKKRQSK